METERRRWKRQQMRATCVKWPEEEEEEHEGVGRRQSGGRVRHRRHRRW